METFSQAVNGQFSPQVLVLAARLPYFSSLVASKPLQHLVQMDRGDVRNDGRQQRKQQQASLNVATPHTKPVWKDIDGQLIEPTANDTVQLR